MQKDLFKKEEPSALDDFSKPKQILLNYTRNKFGEITGVRHCDFQPNLIIERCGRRYKVDATGRQTRIL
jgi:hypothetical protein